MTDRKDRPRIIEHEPLIMTTKGTLRRSDLSAMNQQKSKEPPAPQTQPKPDTRLCPFSKALNVGCRDNCALYCGGACAIARIAKKTAKSQSREAGAVCPFTKGQCSQACALYHDGACAITAIANSL